MNAVQNQSMTAEFPFASLGQPTTETELQALVNATPGVSLLIDLDGVIVCANVKATRHFGIGLGQLIGSNVYSLFDEATARGRKWVMSRPARALPACCSLFSSPRA